MRKFFKVIKSEKSDRPDSETGFLASHSRANTTSAPQSSSKLRLRIHVGLFLFGLVSSIACLWTMIFTSNSEQVAKKLGLYRVANSLENILSLLAYPILMFMFILTLYAAQQLYRMYRDANAPAIKRRRRR